MHAGHRVVAVASPAVATTSLLCFATASAQDVEKVNTPAVSSSDKASPVFGIKIQPGYRDWKLVSVAHEAGKLNDIRAILGNDKAMKSFRAGGLSFPDGSVIARLAWSYVRSEENNKAFGRDQSFVAGPAPEWHLQFMVKDSKTFATTGGWGFAQFDKDGNPAPEAPHLACFACHQPAAARDFVFTHYAP